MSVNVGTAICVQTGRLLEAARAYGHLENSATRLYGAHIFSLCGLSLRLRRVKVVVVWWLQTMRQAAGQAIPQLGRQDDQANADDGHGRTDCDTIMVTCWVPNTIKQIGMSRYGG